MTWAVDTAAGTRNRPASVQGFDSIHYPRDIFGQGKIAASQLF
jgi:hypothetical protein